jgi:sugar lactone lactonase YvrE
VRNWIAVNQLQLTRTNMKTNTQSHFKFTLIIVWIVLAVAAGGLIPKSAYAAPGDLYVPDLTDVTNPIYVFTPDGTPGTPSIFATIGSTATDGILGVAFDSGGNLFASDAVGVGRIIKITPAGAQSTFASGLNFPVGLAFDSAGNLFEADNFSGTIFKFTPPFTDSGNVPSPFACGLTSPRGVVFDSAGKLYVSDDGGDMDGQGKILTFSSGGTQSTFAIGLNYPRGLAFDSAGSLYVVEKRTDASVDGGDIIKFTPTGTRTRDTNIIATATGLAQPIGIALDGASNAFVVESGYPPDILKFTPVGTRSFFVPPPDMGGGLISPAWLAFEPNTPASPNPVMVNIGTVESAVIALTFPQITFGGATMVTPIDPSLAGTLPSAYELTGGNLAFEITTTATYTTPPPIIIAFQVPPPPVDPTFSQWRVLHNEGGTLVDRTVLSGPFAPNPTTQTIYASVSSLSPFVIAKLTFSAQVQQPINADGTSVFNVRRGVVPVKFTLTQGGVATCALPPATIALTRTAGGTTGAVDESVYTGSADTGSNFRIDSCQYIYNLSSGALGVGTYRVDITINGTVVGNAIFQLK